MTCLEAPVINTRNHDKAHSNVSFSRAFPEQKFHQIKAPLYEMLRMQKVFYESFGRTKMKNKS